MNTSFLKVDLKKKANSRERIIFFVALAVFCFGFGKACVYASYQALSEIDNQAKELERESQQLSQPLQNAQAPMLMPQGKQWVGSEKGFSEAISAMMTPIHQKGVKLIKSQFSEIKKEGPYQFREVALDFSGSYSAIGSYLEYLEAMVTPLVIKNFSMHVDEGSELMVEITGGIYGSI